VPQPKRSEKSIQKAVVDYARKRGCIAIKLSTNGRFGTSGWPDYMFLRGSHALFIEFKRQGGKLTPKQGLHIQILRDAGFPAEVVDTVEWGKLLINRALQP
jgi:hypothetical protein